MEIARYRNGGNEVVLHSDGSKVRRTADPSVPPSHPESIDWKITDWCDAGCAWCHESSTRRGRHGDVDASLQLVSSLPPGVEIAIGGGDALSHPDFERFVLSLRDMGLVPSVTVNGRHLQRHMGLLEKLIDRGALFGVGVSIHRSIPEWDYEHMVVHAIAGIDDPSLFEISMRLKVLVLGYKQHGRAVRHAQRLDLRPRIGQWRREIAWMAHAHHLSFDTLAIEQLRPQRLFRRPEDYAARFMGGEGAFSMYVDGVETEYAPSSYSTRRWPWTSMDSMFATVRQASSG